ncbi:polyprenyl synthetase family protein [Pseudonocardia acaciae]|uniref:polyprenyl synthetase family protein n=1 Tax=Pseudonocardia acaciae TaxID=551276 RepID=UPI0004900D04|nr:polyprenyl synthetase family protein [Pseudonocardia acaciae]
MTTVFSAAPDILTRARDLVAPAMRAAVGRLDPANERIVSYHLGWTELDGSPSESGGGKGVRPALATLSASAAGADPRVAVPGAIAVELVHNFSLLHDDVMDGDTQRRHRGTVWAVWGTPSAILSGDGLLALAVEVLLDEPTPAAARAARLIAETTRELVRGQTEDLAFERRSDVPLSECLAMAGGKTGALLSASAAIGAVLAGAPDQLVRALARYGTELGLAFQLVDDLLGIWGDPVRTGKPVYADLRAGKKSLPVTYALTHGRAPGRELAAWLATVGENEDIDEAAVLRAAELVEAAGGRRWAADEARRRLATAERALNSVRMDPTARAELLDIAHFVVAREA